MAEGLCPLGAGWESALLAPQEERCRWGGVTHEPGLGSTRAASSAQKKRAE